MRLVINLKMYFMYRQKVDVHFPFECGREIQLAPFALKCGGVKPEIINLSAQSESHPFASACAKEMFQPCTNIYGDDLAMINT